MAKRYKEEAAEEEPEFKIPPFDEQKFINRERRNIKTVFISFLLGIVIALISFGFWVLLTGNFLQWELVLLFGVFNMPWVRFIILKLHIDVTEFGRRGWLSAYATYFFTWLIILIVLVNPPFYDGESPQIQAVALPGAQTPGGTVLIVAHITDNVRVSSFNFSYTDPQGTPHSPPTSYQNGILQFLYNQNNTALGKYNYTLTATDPSNHRTVVSGNFTYTANALNVSSSQTFGLRSGDTISIRADPRISKDNFLVYYGLDNGAKINATRRTPSDRERYETSPEFQGWTPNSTLTMSIHAEVSYYFLNNPVRYANNVTSSQTFTISTGIDPAIGATPDPKPNYALPQPTFQGATPGFEIIVALGALAVVVLVVRKQRRKR
jgi:hypothetical protein